MEKNINAVNLGRLGGLVTKKKHGLKHYQALAAHMNQIKAAKKLPQPKT